MFVRLGQGEALFEETIMPQGAVPSPATPVSTPATPGAIAEFLAHWNAVRDSFASILRLRSDLDALEDRLGRVNQQAAAQGDQATSSDAAKATARVRALQEQWRPVQAAIEKWNATWQTIARAVGQATSWFGLGAIWIPVAAIAALGLVATVGLYVLNQYRRERTAADLLERKLITPAQWLQAPETRGGFFEQLAQIPTTIAIVTGLGLVILVMSMVDQPARRR